MDDEKESNMKNTNDKKVYEKELTVSEIRLDIWPRIAKRRKLKRYCKAVFTGSK